MDYMIDGYDRWYRALAPNESLFHDYKTGLCGEEEYTRRFIEQMKNNNIAQERMHAIRELAKDKEVYLICWEKTGFCHRFLLIEMINNLDGMHAFKIKKQATLF